MTLNEIETLIEDTRKASHAGDKMTQSTALGVLEVARQLTILNAHLSGKGGAAAGKKSGKK